DGIRDFHVTGVQTCALPISRSQIMDRNRTIASYAELTADLETANTAFQAEVDSLTDQRDALTLERDALTVERDALATERDEFERSEERRVGKGNSATGRQQG